MRFRLDGVPPGSYIAKFCGCEDYDEGDYGPSVAFVFLIDEGPMVGQRVTRISRERMTRKNSTGRLISQLLSRALDYGVEFDIDSCVGRRYQIVVGEGRDSGTPRVESCQLIQ